MDIHFKVTAWETLTVPEDKKSEVIKAMKDGQILSATDLVTFFIDDTNVENKGISDYTIEQMHPEEQDGYATIIANSSDGKEFNNSMREE